MAVILVSRAFSADPEASRRECRTIARCLTLSGHLPLAPQIYLPQFIDETCERDVAMRLCLALVAVSDEVRVYGEPSEGMRLEIAEAYRLGIPVVDGVTGEMLLPKGQPPR